MNLDLAILLGRFNILQLYGEGLITFDATVS